MRIKLGLFASSPVYYQAPLYRRLAADPRVDFTAIFASSAGATRPIDNGFGAPVSWGVDVLSGYRSVFLRRADQNPTGGGISALRDLDVIAEVFGGRYDVLWLHGYHTITHILALLAQRARRGSVLVREEQTLLSPRPLWKRCVKALALRPLLAGSYGLFIGTENRRWFTHWGVPEGRLVSVPYVVDNDTLQAQAAILAPRREGLRAALGVAPGAGPTILMVARLIEKKQPLHLLEAFRRVRASTQCTLLVVGSGPLEQQMRQQVAEREIPDVVFAGFMDQMHIAEAYSAADVFVLGSSHDETWGLVVNEAMNFGLPIIVTDRVGCATDLVLEGRNGFVVPYDDLDALAQAIARVVQDADLRRRLGAGSLEVIAEWTYDAGAAGIMEAVRRAVGSSRWSLAERSTAASVGLQRD